MLKLALNRKKSGKNEALALAKKMLALPDSMPLIKKFEDAAVGDQNLERIASKLRLSRTLDCACLQVLDNKALIELTRIVALGVEKGSKEKKALLLFAARLEHEIKAENRFRAKSGGLQTLTYMGMGLFFPLFSSISAIILSGSLGLFGKSTAGLSGGFILVAACYIPIILYLTSAFSHPERSALRNMLSITPYFALGMFVIAASQVYLANIL